MNSQGNYLTAKEPEQRVAHMPPMVAPGPAPDIFFIKLLNGTQKRGNSSPYYFKSQLNTMLKMLNDTATADKNSLRVIDIHIK